MVQKALTWTCGVTTVPERRDGLLHDTLMSLERGGFPSPRLFVDRSTYPWGESCSGGRAQSIRDPRVGAYGNWVLAAWELFLRDPEADRYAIFQDDVICSANLRPYLDAAAYPERGYLNLYTFPVNQELCVEGHEGFYLSNQRGKGACALVFSNLGMQTLLGSDHLVAHATDKRLMGNDPDSYRRTRNIDGAVIEAFKKSGWQEWVHNPSLIQHTGTEHSTIRGRNVPDNWKATSFRGEEYDCLELLKAKATS